MQACSIVTMPSADHSEPLDLERDLPTSHEDVVALRRLRASAALSQAEYFRFLSRLPAPPLEKLRARKGPRGEPFRL